MISDIVFSTLGDPLVGDCCAGVFLLSDGDPLFAQVILIPSVLRTSPQTILEETGQLQDLTPFLGTAPFGLRVQVQSDVIPEPATFALLGLGVGTLGVASRRRQQRTA